jgi:hypothetical protein
MRNFGNRIISNKYGASKTTFKGITFDSRYECDRYLYLSDLQRKLRGAGGRASMTLSEPVDRHSLGRLGGQGLTKCGGG